MEQPRESPGLAAARERRIPHATDFQPQSRPENFIETQETHTRKVFIRVCLAQLISVMGERTFMLTALPLWTFDRFHTARSVSIALLAVIVPALFSLPAGGWVSRFSTRNALLACGFIRFLLTGLLLVLALQTWRITLGLVFLVSLTDSFFMPALKAALPDWVGEKHLLQATSVLEGTDIPSQVFGPVCALALYGQWGIEGPVAAQVLAYGGSLGLLWSSRIPVTKQVIPSPDFWDHLAGLLKRAWANLPVRGTLMSWTLGMMVAGITEALMLPFVQGVLHQPETLYGVFGTLIGVGMALGAVISSVYEPEMRPQQLLAVSACLLAVSFALFTQCRTVVLCGVALVAAGTGLVWVHVSANTVLLTALDEGDRAGVLGLTHSIEAGGILLGLAAAGAGAERWGVPALFDGAAAILVLAVLISLYTAFLPSSVSESPHESRRK